MPRKHLGHVLAVRHGLEMIRIDTGSVGALVMSVLRTQRSAEGCL
jgi:hypothetical protein